MRIACLRGNMKAMSELKTVKDQNRDGIGCEKMPIIPIAKVWAINGTITHPCVHYHFKGFHTNWMNFSANTLYFPTTPIYKL